MFLRRLYDKLMPTVAIRNTTKTRFQKGAPKREERATSMLVFRCGRLVLMQLRKTKGRQRRKFLQEEMKLGRLTVKDR